MNARNKKILSRVYNVDKSKIPGKSVQIFLNFTKINIVLIYENYLVNKTISIKQCKIKF